jgi:hypothetical protein
MSIDYASLLTSMLGGAAAGFATFKTTGVKLIEKAIDHKLAKERDRDQSNLRIIEKDDEREKNRNAVIEATLQNYGGVVLISASDLQDRLWHLCNRQYNSKNPILLAESMDTQAYDAWPMTKRHYLYSTLFLFCRYFCWIEIIKEAFRFLDFGSSAKTNQFQYLTKRVERAFAETSLQKLSRHQISTDRPVFQLDQSEIGASLIRRNGNNLDCIYYKEFLGIIETEIEKNQGIGRLIDLLSSSMSHAKSNFCQTRLRLAANALVDLIEFLHKDRQLASAETAERINILDFDNGEYLVMWPTSLNNISQ